MQEQTPPVTDKRSDHEERRARRQAAALPEDAFKGLGTTGGLPRTGWLKSPWRPVGRLWRQVRGNDEG